MKAIYTGQQSHADWLKALAGQIEDEKQTAEAIHGDLNESAPDRTESRTWAEVERLRELEKAVGLVRNYVGEGK